jgi:hypothetical protein
MIDRGTGSRRKDGRKAWFIKHAEGQNVARYSVSDVSSIDSKGQASKGNLVHPEESLGV